MAVEITRRERSAGELRREAGRTKDAKASRRMLALALVLDGRSRTEAAESCGMDRQTLRDWVHRYNAEGLAGLFDRPCRGARPCSTRSRWASWRRSSRRGRTRRRTASCAGGGSTSAGSSSGASGFASRSGRWARPSAGSASPSSPHGPVTRRETRKPKSYIKSFADLARAALPDDAKGKPLEVWFQML